MAKSHGRRQKKLTLEQFQQQKRALEQERIQQRQQQIQEKQQQKKLQKQKKKQQQQKKNKKAQSPAPVAQFEIHYKPSEQEVSIQKLISKHVSIENGSTPTVDPIIMNYLGSILEAQNDDETCMEELQMTQWIKRILLSHYGIGEGSSTQDGSTQDGTTQDGSTQDGTTQDGTTTTAHKKLNTQLNQLLINLKENNLIKERLSDSQLGTSHVQRLEEAVSLGKEYEDTEAKHRESLSATKQESRWNDDLDWDKKMLEELKRKKEKKLKKERQEQTKQYESFLNSRGLTLDRKNDFVRIHRKEESFGGSRDVNLENITLRIGDKTLLEDSSLHLVDGGKYGLIGRNGVGKTTLLRNIFERELQGVPVHLQILHVQQEVAASTKSALDLVLETDFERIQLLSEEKRLLASNEENIGEKLQEVYEKMEQIDAHSAEARAASILGGLSFTQDMMNAPSSSLSGGWRMRIALARALFVEPDVLLLDEPTSHLDLNACLFLEEYLRSYRKTLVLVSHARSFINAVVSEIIHFTNQRKLETYKGNYDTFETTRNQRMISQQKQYETQQKQKAHIQKYIDKNRYKAATAKMAQSRMKLLAKMSFMPELADDPEVQLSIPEVEEVPPPHIQVIDVGFGWGAKSVDDEDKLLFKGVHVNVSMDSRVALVGANGAGKSTFMSLLMQQIEPVSGEIQVNRKIRIAHFSQHHVDRLDMRLTPVEFMQQRYPGVDSQSLRAHLGSMGVTTELQMRPIYTMSGGQKSRISFADLTYQKPHILCLDEVSNYLDMETIDAMIHAFNNYKGGILLISHDEYLIERVCDEIWVCGDGKIKQYKGDFQSYKKKIMQGAGH